MKSLILAVACLSGTLMFASTNITSSIDNYYSSLDLEGYTVAEYFPKGKFVDDESGREIYRKRAHRRKRMIRPPSRGK